VSVGSAGPILSINFPSRLWSADTCGPVSSNFTIAVALVYFCRYLLFRQGRRCGTLASHRPRCRRRRGAWSLWPSQTGIHEMRLAQ
jgi:hypothetical protein